MVILSMEIPDAAAASKKPTINRESLIKSMEGPNFFDRILLLCGSLISAKQAKVLAIKLAK